MTTMVKIMVTTIMTMMSALVNRNIVLVTIAVDNDVRIREGDILLHS